MMEQAGDYIERGKELGLFKGTLHLLGLNTTTAVNKNWSNDQQAFTLWWHKPNLSLPPDPGYCL